VASPPAPRAPTLAVSEFALHARVPQGDPVGDRAAQLFRSITDVELEAHLTEACAGLIERDSEAVWVLRELAVRARVPASETDVRGQSRRIAGSVARAIGGAIGGERGGRAVRFASRADHVAQFLAAARRGAGESWVFAPFRALAALPPTVALPLACRLADVPPWEVIARLARAGEWRRLLVEATDTDVARLDRALAHLARATPSSRAVVDAARVAAAATASEGVGSRSPAVRRLLTLGHVVVAFDGSVTHAAATWLVSPAGSGPADELGAATALSHPAGAALPRREAAPAEPAAESARVDAPGSLFAAPGAVAFMLLPGLDDVADELGAPWLADATPEGTRAREALLAMAVGRGSEIDDAIRLAAGRPPAELGDPRRWRDRTEDDADGAAPEPPWAVLTPPSPDWLTSPEDRAWLDPDGTAPDGLVLAASGAVRRFLRGLAGFGRAPLPYVMPRVLPRGGMVASAPDVIDVVLPNPPLQVLLQIAGLDAFTCRVPWIAQTIVVSHQESS
jgi:hypothetical protein